MGASKVGWGWGWGWNGDGDEDGDGNGDGDGDEDGDGGFEDVLSCLHIEICKVAKSTRPVKVDPPQVW